MNVDDVFLVLHHHWALDTSTFPDERQRLQLAFLVLLCAYTATRPGALVYVKRNVEVLAECPICEAEEKNVKCGDSDSELDNQNIRGDAMDLDHEEIIECLCYKHITLVLLPARHHHPLVMATGTMDKGQFGFHDPWIGSYSNHGSTKFVPWHIGST